MLEEMTANQFKEWCEFDSLEPIGMYGHFIGHGTVASTIANVNRDSEKQPKPFSVFDFMPESFRPESLTAEEIQKEENRAAWKALRSSLVAKHNASV